MYDTYARIFSRLGLKFRAARPGLFEQHLRLPRGVLAQLVGQRLPRILGVLDVPTELQLDVQDRKSVV